MQTQPTPDDRKMTPVEGHPGIYRKGSRYVVTWKHRGKSRKSSHRTLSEAVRAKGRRASGHTEPVARQRFDDYARAWVESYGGRTRRGIGDSTRASYRDAIERVAIPFFRGARLGDITARDIRDYVDELRRRGLRSATIRRYVAPLRAMFAEAVADLTLPINPTSSVRVFVRGEQRRRPRTLVPEQILALVEAIPVEHRDLVAMLAYTGVRISEALAAVWGDLAQEDGAPVLRIPDSKTDAGVRSVPLSPEFNRRLLRRRAAAKYATDADPVFPSAVGTPMDRRNFNRRVWRPAVESAGVEATPHTLRHSLASLLFEHGHTAAQIAALLGHSDPSFTLRTYVHARDVGDVAFLDDVFAGE